MRPVGPMEAQRGEEGLGWGCITIKCYQSLGWWEKCIYVKLRLERETWKKSLHQHSECLAIKGIFSTLLHAVLLDLFKIFLLYWIIDKLFSTRFIRIELLPNVENIWLVQSIDPCCCPLSSYRGLPGGSRTPAQSKLPLYIIPERLSRWAAVEGSNDAWQHHPYKARK